MQSPCIARALRFQKYVLHTSGSPDRSKSPENNFQTSLTSKSPKCIYIYVYIYLYIYIKIYRYTPGSSDPASLPSMSSEQVCQASFPSIYIYIYIYVFIYIYIYTYQSSSKSSKPFLLSHNPGVHPLLSLAQIVTIKFVRLGPINTLF